MAGEIPNTTISALARSIFKEASSYGFGQIDIIRLINELMDLCMSSESMGTTHAHAEKRHALRSSKSLAELPVKGERVSIRAFNAPHDCELLERWLPEKYGRYFVLSCATAQSTTVEALTSSPNNHVGIITLHDGTPIGAMAMLDHSRLQRRAELRKLIGEPKYRGQGIAEEATRLWVHYGIQGLGLEKIYVSTLQTQVANIKLNESIGFKVEGLLRDEVLIDGLRCDVLRMGLTIKDS
ncbi:MAG: GNAT family N-acetyltransferase [Gammaproteobacteria bacterium]|nr:GNAT family N-acetyltransferase [Gammaproteobacteria bacterium]MDH5241364.1 GNAT family N-acetyltransferase [Gammaproteobacteria bacterium]MDH5261449.1 GNAT family N-acetyltransferase [Gammaproteobacteria bacterium]